MLVARDHRLSPVGFIGVGRDGQARSVSPVSGFDGQSRGHGAWGDSWAAGTAVAATNDVRDVTVWWRRSCTTR
ncbi:hypothetical protein ACIBG5_42560 [Kribbella sp. NPDC050241]|uniref:hypothetical protein n=1 Tax=Kribbella sp. NPDC050241 TaxID=3364115 RepID=UPI00378BD704